VTKTLAAVSSPSDQVALRVTLRERSRSSVRSSAVIGLPDEDLGQRLHAIVDVTETGSSLRANQLRVIDTVLESTPRFIANRDAHADPWKRRKMERLLMVLRGAIQAIDRV